jgi:ribonuclease HI
LLKAATELYIIEQSADSLVVFTDGSKYENGQLGIGMVVPSWNIKSNFSVTAGVSISTGELVAVLKALEIYQSKASSKSNNIY